MYKIRTKECKRLIIEYESGMYYKNGYNFKFGDNGRSIMLKEIRVIDRNWVCLDEVLKRITVKDRNYKKLMHCDPNLIEILYNVKGMLAVEIYMSQISKGTKANKEKLPYTMTYNIKSVWESKAFSIKEKFAMSQMIMKNRYIADVNRKSIIKSDRKQNIKREYRGQKEQERKKVKRLAIMFAAIGIAISTIPQMLPFVKGSNKSDSKEESKNEFIERIDDTYIANETDTDKMVEITESTEVQVDSGVIEEQTPKRFGELSEEEKEIVNSKTQEIMENKKRMELGMAITLPEGTVFTESVSGGRVGKIGYELSPEDGIYVIDYLSEVSEDGVETRHGLSGKIKKNNSEVNQFVHVSLVYGANDINEAEKIIDDQKNKKGKIDKHIIQPRGWINYETMELILEKQNSQIKINELQR